MTAFTVGILALQGNFNKHKEVLTQLKISTQLIRKQEQLAHVQALIIPGGESTTLLKHIEREQLKEPLATFAKTRSIFGTCAGLILMADPLFNLLDIEVERNAYGRQIHSFTSFCTLSFHKKKTKSVFIRAPRIKKLAPNITILGTLGKEPVLIQQDHHLACTFHPELTDDLRIHSYFVKLAKTYL